MLEFETISSVGQLQVSFPPYTLFGQHIKYIGISCLKTAMFVVRHFFLKGHTCQKLHAKKTVWFSNSFPNWHVQRIAFCRF